MSLKLILEFYLLKEKNHLFDSDELAFISNVNSLKIHPNNHNEKNLDLNYRFSVLFLFLQPRLSELVFQVFMNLVKRNLKLIIFL